MAAQSLSQYELSSSSSPSSSINRWNYDVFLSFRGEDTRKNFTGHLYTALVQAGIHAFRDDDELPRGEEISPQLLKAIRGSKMSIVIFSKGYASSRWCLDELSEIIRCRETAVRQLVLPVFYDVDPSDVRKQSGSFAAAFAEHEERFEAEKVERWRAALTQAANLSGWDLQTVANGHESKFIQNMVGEILRKTNHTHLNVAKYPVGIDSRAAEILRLLGMESDGVYMIGIYGMAGQGKTTIAKAVYNIASDHFEGSHFVANVGQISEQPNGLVHLQKELLSEILNKESIELGSVDRGASLIEARLRSKRVLLVLDDLTQVGQLNALAGDPAWFGPGSRIVVTTRDEHLLRGVVNRRYETKNLNYDESLELFSWHAFRKANPLDDYVKISDGIVSYAGGLPLALEVLGSHLFGRTMTEWESAFEKLQQIPNHQIQGKLRISFDALEDDKTKDIFLDIACFFIGMDKDYVVMILKGCGFFPEIGISILCSRSLLKVNELNKLGMHDLLRDMGRAIVREECPRDPGRRSRLWFHGEVLSVLEQNKGTESIEGITLSLPLVEGVHLTTKSFGRMDRLRLLQINSTTLTGSFKLVSKELRWFCWQYCPLKCLPSDFDLQHLVALDMQYSNIQRVWPDVKILKDLKVLNLSHCESLTKTPDFSGMPILRTLLLEGCISLLAVHPSIGILESLFNLNLQDCKSLSNLPGNICKLRSLESLNLNGCLNIDRLPEDLGNLECLSGLSLDGTAIKELPFSCGLLKNLKSLSLKGCRTKLPYDKSWPSLFSSWILPRKSPEPARLLPPTISSLQKLTKLFLSNCNLAEGLIPDEIGSLASLGDLDLCGNNFHSLPSSLSKLTNLEFLLLNECRSLQSLPTLPPNLLHVYAYNCPVENLPNPSSFKRGPSLFLSNSRNLHETVDSTNFNSRSKTLMERWLATALKHYYFKEQAKHESFTTCVPTEKIPDWFDIQTSESSIAFDMPLHEKNKFVGMILWAVYDADERKVEKISAPYVVINDQTNDILWNLYDIDENVAANRENSWVCHVPQSYFGYHMEGGERIEVSVRVKQPLKLKKLGIHLLYKLDVEMDYQVPSSCSYVDGCHRNINVVEASSNVRREYPRRLKWVLVQR